MTHQPPVLPLSDARPETLADQICGGTRFAVTFGGQGAAWWQNLQSLYAEQRNADTLGRLVTTSAALIAPVAAETMAALPRPFDPQSWLNEQTELSTTDLSSVSLSIPGVLLTQLATMDALAAEGLDLSVTAPASAMGHSQGILGVAALASRREASTDDPIDGDAEILALAQLIAAAATIVAYRVGLIPNGHSPMLAITGADLAEIKELTLQASTPQDQVVISAINGPRRLVVTGTHLAIDRLIKLIEQTRESAKEALANKSTGGRVFDPVVEELPIGIGFHHPALEPAVGMVIDWAGRCGLDVALAESLARNICVDPVKWARQLHDGIDADTRWVIDLGPADLAATMTARAVRGRGIGVIAAATEAGRDELFTPGAEIREAADWSEFAPKLRTDGLVETKFTRLTGKAPILLAGMTPTTVDPAIVAAAANAGFWAEWAGGGQVTPEIFATNLAKLQGLLDEGATAQFNSLLLDPYLWKLHLGGQRLVQKARKAGAPIDGVVITAGIPELEEAVEIVGDLHDSGITHVAFKPGTVNQIKQVIAIAREVEGELIVHIEGGVAGGHHSWEDLDELLLATYPLLRAEPNLTICVGGGIGTPDKAVDYLTGRWALQYDEAAMPLDGVLVGTAAMATLEATTSAVVKDLLVATPGYDGWVGAGLANGGVTSGRSQLGADIHEIDNLASRCGRLLDEVAGDAEVVAERREEIIAAMSGTMKPYFGDFSAMTYAQMLERFLELSTRDGQWLDPTFAERFNALLDRSLARVHPATQGPIDRINVADPKAALATLVSEHPSASECLLHPADIHFFIEVCKRPGKPVCFVPVIDADVRRWWRSDSLWQAHDDHYDADQVIVIPGPVSVAGITEKDEPVAHLLARFESAVAEDLETAGVAKVEPQTAAARVVAASDISWAGRLVPNPLRRLGADARVVANSDNSAEITVTLPEAVLRLPLSMSATGVPVISEAAASTAMGELLKVTAGGHLPEVINDRAQLQTTWTPAIGADHAGMTTPSRSRSFEKSDPAPGVVPDALVGLAWPAVFAVIGPVEGLLDLVHLDHRLEVVEHPTHEAELHITAVLLSSVDTVAGRVLTVEVDFATDGRTVANLIERFMIRGRIGSADFVAPEPLAKTETPRSQLDRFTVTSPAFMGAFATVSGDHNPLHTSIAAAKMAGFQAPIVHGMWLSAVGQRAAATALDGQRQVKSWLTRWVAPLQLATDVVISVERIGINEGDLVVEVTAKAAGELLMVAEAVLSAPRTAYAFPGQGIQAKGMGMEARTRSKAAREVWDRADAHTKESLGFSILAVVKDNPTELLADGELHRHPDGVLFLTQFTQVAMATLAVAQVAELREAGVFVEGSITCGHSVGEYNALAAVTGILPLEALLEIVFRRGMAMHHLVPRDAAGNSNYRLAAIRPSQADLTDEELPAFIDGLSETTGEFIQIVNLNLRGSQYAIAGTVAGLKALEAEIEARRARIGGKPAFILVPGIDVPFHSRELHAGVNDFRGRLDALLPERIDASLLIGRYIPNLVPRLFNLDREFVQEICDYVDSELLREALDDWAASEADPNRLARTMLMELLAWQFASPVRWIETQDLLFNDPAAAGGLSDTAAAGLGIEQFIEVGVANAPTLANLAAQTVRLPSYDGTAPRIFNSSRDEVQVFAQDTQTIEEPTVEVEDDTAAPEVGAATSATPVAPSPVAAAPAATSAARPDDLVFTPADATRVLIALRTKIRTDQIGAADTIESLCDGVSSRRNQLLVDLGTELALPAIDGAAEAALPALAVTVDKLARTYSAFGPVLSDAIAEATRSYAASVGAKPSAITERVNQTWQLGHGWLDHVNAALVTGLREGSSARGGDLGFIGAAADLAQAVDLAIQEVATNQGVSVSMPVAEQAGGTVDVAALAELTDAISGPDGMLASTAKHLLAKIAQHNETQPDGQGQVFEDDESDDIQAGLTKLVEAELGTDWARKVAPRFDEKRAVLFDDRWASVREDFARAWHGDEAARNRNFAKLDAAATQQAKWWLNQARSKQRAGLVSFYGRVLSDQTEPAFADDTAIITGAAPGSIAGAVAAALLEGGATVVATTSSLDSAKTDYFRQLYRDHASGGAKLWVLPANLASFSDIDDLVSWVGAPVVATAAGQQTEIRPALAPTLVFPFAAPGVSGTAADAGSRAEVEFRVLVWGVERLITGLAAIGADHRLGQRVHVVLPGSPNRGRFGGDGAYGEAKAAFDALVQKWHVESDWARRISFAHALIGWVRGTGLMGRNDPLVDAVTAAGVSTWSPEEMAAELLALCAPQQRIEAAHAPLLADLTGGLDKADLNLGELARDFAASAATKTQADDAAESDDQLLALTHPAGWRLSQPTQPWAEVSQPLEEMVCIVAAGEVGPVGSSRTRLQLEVEDGLSAAGIIELAWTTGRIVYETEPTPTWTDAKSGESLTEAEIIDRFGEEIEAGLGIRRFHDEGSLIDGTAPLMVPVYCEEDTSFLVRSQDEAQAFVTEDPERTKVEAVEDGFLVTRLKGSLIRVPRRFKLTRFVGAQVPEGFDPKVWGLGAMTESIDRLAAWNLVATIDAFISSGVTPAELLRWVHPTQMANTQGTGIGGMKATRSMYVDALLGDTPQADILQEALPNVIAAHTAQSFLGGYGSMVHPVAACATAAVSVEEGFDKIKLGKAKVVVTGGFDDLGIEGILGFGNMSATAESQAMLDQGISEQGFCRPNDRRRGGFVEGQGGGTLVLVRGDLVAELGLPVLGVVAFAASYSDGIHTSIPAPGLGALGAATGGKESALAKALAELGLSANDIDVISKHDTSTAANDPNESQLHEWLADALGRDAGNPLYVVSQKSLTGHAKGGAAAFQMIGLCQLLADGVLPPNRNLDCVDDALAKYERLVWLRQALQTGPLKAGLVTSLGFGHVSALVAITHPGAFAAALPEAKRADWLAAASQRLIDGQARLLDGMHGGDQLFAKVDNRRFVGDAAEIKQAEKQMLLDPEARLNSTGSYEQAPVR